VTDTAGNTAAELYAELGMAREVIDVQQQQIAELQKAAGDTAAELARAHQATEQLQQRVAELEAAGA
jgi:hypothetical protein